jgi:hypothetical protein
LDFARGHDAGTAADSAISCNTAGLFHLLLETPATKILTGQVVLSPSWEPLWKTRTVQIKAGHDHFAVTSSF